MSDFKTAVRALRKSPQFSIVAVLTIAVGIGANTALFSVYDRLVLNPVTISDPSSLVAIWTNNRQLNFNAPALSWPKYEEIRAHATLFSSVGTLPVKVRDPPRRCAIWKQSASGTWPAGTASKSST